VKQASGNDDDDGVYVEEVGDLEASVLDYVPNEFKTAEFYLEAVKWNGLALGAISEVFKTAEIAELCFEAVKQNGSALRYVPEEFKTVELCLEAARQNGSALEYVPLEHKTVELCFEATKQNDKALYYVPEELREEVRGRLTSSL